MSSGALYALYAALIVLLLLVSVAIHEFGHLLTAKHYGMKATEYFVGFGPKIVSFRRGETEYGLKAIPAGGYVKIIGMSALENDGTRTPEEIEAAAASMSQLPTDMVPDERRLFYTFPACQRSVVLAAGSLTHFVLAVGLIFASLLVGGGAGRVEPVFASVVACPSPNADGSCPPGSSGTAASVAGLRAGDRIVAVDGTPVTSFDQLEALVRRSAGDSLRLTVVRAGRSFPVSLIPTSQPALSAAGDPIPNTAVGFLGISPQVATTGASAGYAAAHTFSALGSTLSSTGSVLAHLPGEVGDVLTGHQRNAATSAVSVVGVVRAAGSVGADSGDDARYKVSYLLAIGGELNLFVGIVNLLPLLPLDGGHIAIVWYEKGRALVARRRRRPDPGRVNILKVLPAAYTVFGLIVLLSVILIYADIAQPITVT